jgi:hypothetical protein
MDLNWFVNSVPGFACLAISNWMAECKNHAPVCLDLRAGLHVDISPVSSIEMQRYATGISSPSRDSCHESFFFS